jgi:ribosome-associated heat shock protein Hsp15
LIPSVRPKSLLPDETGGDVQRVPASRFLIAEPAKRPLDQNRIMDRLRMDKWLWAARFFKTRAIAARACDLSRIESNGQVAKPSREVRVGDLLRIRNNSGDFQVKVLQLSEIRGPAAVAQMLYCETDASRELRLKLEEERKRTPHFEAFREGRPSKKDRRDLGRLRGRM